MILLLPMDQMKADTNTLNASQSHSGPTKPNKGFKRTLFRFLRGLLLAYILVIVLLVIFEPTLVYPGKDLTGGNWNPTHFVFEEVEFASADGTKIVAWFLPKQYATRTALICHGNGENVAQSSASMGHAIRELLNANVLVYDYRGFGKSEGSPHEKGILEDSEAALDWLNTKTGTNPEDVILIGHSIGGGPACFLAGKYGAKSLILQRTFTSLVSAAQHRYPLIPVSLLMRNRYSSKERIVNYTGPLFQSHGTADTLVPFELGEQLFKCCPSEHKVFFPLQGRGHLDPFPDEYWEALVEFVNDVDR